MDPTQLIRNIIKPSLKELDLLADRISPNGLRIVFGTACKESNCGRWVCQFGSGPARGIYQMEPATADDIVTNFLNYHPDIKFRVMKFKMTDDWEELTWNYRLATMMCRLHYYRFIEPIPNSLEGQADYWKTHYNTDKGAGTVAEYISAWNGFVTPDVEKFLDVA